MQRLINAIDKGTKAGAYSLEELSGYLTAIDQVGAVVQEFNKIKAAEAEAAQAPQSAPDPAGKKPRGANKKV